MDELLFSNGRLSDSLEHEATRVLDAVEAVPEEHLLQVDVDEFAAALADEFKVECAELQLAEMYRQPTQDVKVDVSWDRSRYFSEYTTDRRIAGHRVVVKIPFRGDKTAFKLRPNHFTLNPPQGRVVGDELVYTIEWPHDTPTDIDGRVSGFLGPVQQWLEWARAEIESFNATLERLARSAIDARRLRIRQRDEHVEKSSIPVGRPGTRAKTYIAEAVVRRPAPRLPTKSAEAGVQLEPVLEQEVFEHILSVVRMQALQMEQSPKTYAAMDEEARRDLFLAMLNTHYEGRASAEAFNVDGKTDILIRFEGRSLFIAECKFWEGAKRFIEAVDQLFGYVSWRDTKLALIVFVRERGLTEIIEKARKALAEHPEFISWQEAASETELRAVVSWPGDERRRAELNVFFVQTPV